MSWDRKKSEMIQNITPMGTEHPGQARTYATIAIENPALDERR
jgi:hypothetical protein